MGLLGGGWVGGGGLGLRSRGPHQSAPPGEKGGSTDGKPLN
jgi:hypothetical protein